MASIVVLQWIQTLRTPTINSWCRAVYPWVWQKHVKKLFPAGVGCTLYTVRRGRFYLVCARLTSGKCDPCEFRSDPRNRKRYQQPGSWIHHVPQAFFCRQLSHCIHVLWQLFAQPAITLPTVKLEKTNRKLCGVDAAFNAVWYSFKYPTIHFWALSDLLPSDSCSLCPCPYSLVLYPLYFLISGERWVIQPIITHRETDKNLEPDSPDELQRRWRRHTRTVMSKSSIFFEFNWKISRNQPCL